MKNVLQTALLIRPQEHFDDGGWRSQRHFIDFVIDGVSLWQRTGKPMDMVSVFCAEYGAEEAVLAAQRLLLRAAANLPDERRSLFICAECGDLGCGAITAIVERTQELIIWRDFGYENNWEARVELAAYKDIGPFSFDAHDYSHSLANARESIIGIRAGSTD